MKPINTAEAFFWEDIRWGQSKYKRNKHRGGRSASSARAFRVAKRSSRRARRRALKRRLQEEINE